MQQVVQAAMAAHVNGPSRHQTAARWSADGILNVALVESNALLRETVDVRSAHQWMAIARNAHGPQCLGHEKDEVRPARRRCGLARTVLSQRPRRGSGQESAP